MMAAPAMAGITITIDGGVDPAVVTYTRTTDVDRVRAFALDIKVDSGPAVITAIGEGDSNYWVHPGDINIVAGVVEQEGSHIANAIDYPVDTNAGIGTDAVTIEMATLYVPAGGDPDPNGPPNTGVICTISVDATCDVTISENVIRGGVVYEDATSATGDLDLSGAEHVTVGGAPIECYQKAADVALWRTLGSPPCWCFPNQCYGDIDGATEGKGAVDVGSVDLGLFLAAWQSMDVCADLDHDTEGKGGVRVGSVDLGILLVNWQGNPAADCNAP